MKTVFACLRFMKYINLHFLLPSVGFSQFYDIRMRTKVASTYNIFLDAEERLPVGNYRIEIRRWLLQ